MNCLCSLLWHGDDDVLISHMRIVLKGCPHAIPKDIMTMIYKWLVSYDLN